MSLAKATSRRDFLRTLGIGAAAIPLASCVGGQQVTAGGAPNVVLLYLDDATFTNLGCFGGPSATPNIDKLANEGMKFSRFYVSSAVCTPSRYSAITGRLASRATGIENEYPHGGPVRITWNTTLTNGEQTLAHQLRNGGYRTGMVGKWHLSPHHPETNKGRDDIDPRSREGKKELEDRYAQEQKTVMETGGFDYADAIYFNNINGMRLPKELRHHNVEWQLEKAIEFVGQGENEPFFLYWPTPIIHGPNPFLSLEADPRITPKGYLDQPPNVDMPPRKELFDRLYTYGTIDPREDGNGWWESGYGSAAMSWLDDAVGAFVRKLEELGQRENTMIIIASDNGLQRGKNSCYEAGANVPALINWPGHVRAGSVCDEIVSNLDFAPTIMEAAGMGHQADETCDGVSILPLLDNPEQAVRKSVMLEVGCTRAVVTKDYKYLAVRFPDDVLAEVTGENIEEFSHDATRDVDHRFGAHVFYPGYFDTDQLYYLTKDKHEQINLAKDRPGVLDAMKKIMTDYSKGLPHSFGEFSS
ncbi:MAG: sulfatase-like hydrolase/transferase [Chloroflexi bacterium]|jgi:arylsulfatase A-like enzyme|nr:sulfatase-like hydrolase/transferase [Chloroflexota bacterium]